ncbi:MAG TPA: Crp/Fnr family transcriptional regulator [Gammaproteobacteria bacterium]|nr:Crp/Fnr family transcriptional regulator [Gammaproteobacteria bacterium]
MAETNWKQVLPELNEASDDAIRALFDQAPVISLEKDSTVFRPGDACQNYLVILDGKVKVFNRAENGREILLYRLSPGDACVLTTSCLFGNKNYPAEGKTESDVRALAIPVAQFNRALQESAIFREQVFSAFSEHLTDLITLVEEVAFGKLDVRLARYLIKQCDENNTLASTHQNIATELGSAREVISRQLKELESQGIITITRGKITIQNVEALKSICNY